MTEHWTGWKLAACWVLAVVGCWIVVVGALIGIYDGLIAMRDLARPCTAVPYAIDERPKCVRVGRKRRLVLENPDTFVRPPAIEEGELPIG